jgi:hypothetical protein
MYIGAMYMSRDDDLGIDVAPQCDASIRLGISVARTEVFKVFENHINGPHDSDYQPVG